MTKKILSLMLIGLVLNLAFYTTKANTIDNQKEAKFAEKVKLNIAKLGVGKEAKVQVKLKDGTKLKGFISEITDDYFVVTNEKDGQSTAIPYPQVKQVKGKNNLSGKTIIVITGFILAVLAAIALASSD
jgi:small nuclear ribonucleoprotein (snRNP)-like protein